MSILVATGQQIGAGWTPALSVVKALAALAAARRLGGEALYWMADEDHDRVEVASTVGFQGPRLIRHRFRFEAPEGTATGWLPWGENQQREAEVLWGDIPTATEPTLRGHALALGAPLWERGIRPYSPTRDADRAGIQGTLKAWRALGLEADLARQADRLEAAGAPLPLDPRNQSAWFSLDPATGRRRRLEPAEPCPPGCWLSPGAALRPLMQSLLLPVTHVVLGPAERAYWRLAEPLWERVGLTAPEILARPSAFVLPTGCGLDAANLDALRAGTWAHFATHGEHLPSAVTSMEPDPDWTDPLAARYRAEWDRFRQRLTKLDRRVIRDRAAERLGVDPERLRQVLFPFEKPQERVLPGLYWLKNAALLDRLLEALQTPGSMHLIPEPHAVSGSTSRDVEGAKRPGGPTSFMSRSPA